MIESKLTPEEFAGLIKESKPYLIALEEMVEECKYGELEVKLSVRGGVVENMQFWRGKKWFKRDGWGL